VLLLDSANQKPPRFISGTSGNLQQCGVRPKFLSFLKIDTVLSLVFGALIGVSSLRSWERACHGHKEVAREDGPSVIHRASWAVVPELSFPLELELPIVVQKRFGMGCEIRRLGTVANERRQLHRRTVEERFASSDLAGLKNVNIAEPNFHGLSGSIDARE
jgi:hypothetical protein